MMREFASQNSVIARWTTKLHCLSYDSSERLGLAIAFIVRVWSVIMHNTGNMQKNKYNATNKV